MDREPKSLVFRWVRRLSCHAELTREDQDVLEQLGASARTCTAQEDLARPRSPADRAVVMLEGMACQCKLLPDGRRQILAYLFAGEMCDPWQLLSHVGYSMSSVVPSKVLTLTLGSLQLLERHPNLARAIAKHNLVHHAITREWLINVGHRTAFERLGHLICEIFVRLKGVGLATGYSFELPLTQAELGDTLALSAVHVNRTLMELRRLKLVTFQNHHLQIHDFSSLCAASGFDSGYLQVREVSLAHAELEKHG